MKFIEHLFLYLIFPGFLFSSVMGLLVGWVDRKVTARVQYRVGPPWYQNFLDVLKLLFFKETLIPEGVSAGLFLAMPVVSAAAATAVSTIILVANAIPAKTFVGDLVVVVYIMMIPSIALMLGGFASRNPLASLGASREMKLILSYELPFILALVVPIMKSGYSIRLGDILLYQHSNGAIVASISGVISFIAALLCVHAKLGFVPFDMPEAETELMGGAYIEYSGKVLGIFKIAKAILFFSAPAFLVTLYFGGFRMDPAGFITGVLWYLAIVVVIVVIKNTNPRVRIDQAVGFFWGPVTIMALVAAGVAFLGY